ncbi:hypothetical protein [Amycolatopsis sp.]|uniref:hypothetical protein n=1 Tax=Amycolatopsis sp. TaxID=37632 RepID=UPI002613E381|nr:hypothetical protein [Amycolatopsis sp.]
MAADLAISPDHVSVRRWLDGGRPRDETIRCIAAALSTKLGRDVSFAEIGFDSVQGAARADITEDGTRYPVELSQAVDLLDSLTTADLAVSPTVTGSAWTPETAPGVITGYLFSAPLGQPYVASAPEAPTAARIRTTTNHLTELDFQFGGGHTRSLLLFYWKSEIVPTLRNGHSGVARREIFSAASGAAKVLGWSAYDAGRHGDAQRYFVQALRLAREADDHEMGGQILSNLSHQANYLGKFTEAAQYARAAQSAIAGSAGGTVRAMFLTMEARALASLGDTKGCVDVLHRADQEFERRDPVNDPDWSSYFDALELAGEAAHCFRDLGRSRETQQFAAQAIEPLLTPPRTRAFIGMVNAAGALNGGNLEEAISLASEAVSLAGSLQSSRYLRYVSDFHQSLGGSHAGHPLVRRFTDLVKGSYPDIKIGS